MLQTFINIVHIFVSMVLVSVVLLQQGKGGGMGAAFGGATTQVFGGRGAGNILTKATAICAAVFMLTSVSLAYLSSSGDRALKARVAQEAGRKDKGELKERSQEAPASTDATPVAPAPETEGSEPSEETGGASEPVDTGSTPPPASPAETNAPAAPKDTTPPTGAAPTATTTAPAEAPAKDTTAPAGDAPTAPAGETPSAPAP